MMIRSLENTPKEVIYEAFRKAFENYVIPLEFNQEAYLKRWEMTGVEFSLSYGAFEEEELVAFILNVPIKGILYNLGTGVLPHMRGKHLPQKIYSELIPKLKGIHTLRLEVIKGNDRAISVYEKLGFIKRRELHSFQGTISIPIVSDLVCEKKKLEFTDEMRNMSLFNPGSEAQEEVLKRSPLHELYEVKKNGTLLAWMAYTPSTSIVRNVGAVTPMMENLDHLFSSFNQMKMRVMNVDSKAQDLKSYLESRNLDMFVTQFEMDRSLT